MNGGTVENCSYHYREGVLVAFKRDKDSYQICLKSDNPDYEDGWHLYDPEHVVCQALVISWVNDEEKVRGMGDEKKPEGTHRRPVA